MVEPVELETTVTVEVVFLSSKIKCENCLSSETERGVGKYRMDTCVQDMKDPGREEKNEK